jgi:hypothetical protein
MILHKSYIIYPDRINFSEIKMCPKHVNTYTLDTLQIYFAWDDDLYTYLKERGFGQSGFQRKTLPIIYSDNCESTAASVCTQRKYVINPRYFGKTYEQLGWKPTGKETEPIIPAEKPKMTIEMIDSEFLKFKILPQVDGREQYHLEYSTMSAFGRLYTNWAIPVMTMNDFRDLTSKLLETIKPSATKRGYDFVQTEEKQRQRELMYYVEIPVSSYKFSIGEFLHAKDFLALNGVKGTLPSLVFKNESKYLEKLQPVLKVGFVQTSKEQGFEIRKPQCALKIAQPKMTTSLRGKRSKAKGLIIEEDTYENYFTVLAEDFARSSQTIVKKYSVK